jgi:phosphoglycolate phosphatase
VAKRYDTIIFDLDGTLADTLPDVAHSINGARERMGFGPIPESQVRLAVGPGREEFIQIIFPEVDCPDDKAFLSNFRDIYWHRCLQTTKLFPGMEDVLIKLDGLNLAVATNKPMRFSEKILRGLGIWDRLKLALGPEDVKHAKPHPEMIVKAMEMLKTKPGKTLFVGDTDKDVLAGRGAGVDVCGVTYGYGDQAVLKQNHPDYLVATPDALLAIIDLAC